MMGRVYPTIPKRDRTGKDNCRRPEKIIDAKHRGIDILELMRTKYGLDPSLRTVYDTLKRADLVWITGRSIHPKTDLEAQEDFKKTSHIK